MFNRKEYNREYRLKNKEKIRVQRKEYYLKNKEKIRAYNAEYYAKPENRKKKREVDVIGKRKYRKKHPEMRMGRINYNEEHYEMWKINQVVRGAVKSGKLKKQPCEVCGDENVHAHHDDYNSPLDVKWLCPLHHKELHNKVEKQITKLKANK